MMRDGRAAMDDFAMAIKLSPHSAHVYFNRANLFASLKMLAEAEQDYTAGTYRLVSTLAEWLKARGVAIGWAG